MWIVLIHAISEIGVCCPNFIGVDDKTRNSRDQKRQEVRGKAELGGKVLARPRVGGHCTKKGEGAMGTATM